LDGRTETVAVAKVGNSMNNHAVGNQFNGQSFGAFGIFDYDDPVTIRVRKYATGTHVLLKELGVETEATPREVALNTPLLSFDAQGARDLAVASHPVQPSS
jgi:hypothetical protein